MTRVTFFKNFAVLGLLLTANIFGIANACTITQTKWGLRGEDCFALQPSISIKQPNVVVSRVSSFLINTEVTVDAFVKNEGTAGTEGLFTFIYGPDGSFNVSGFIEVRDLRGNRIQVWDAYSQSYVNEIRITQRSPRLAPQQTSSANYGLFYLPNRDLNYDVCITITADSKTSTNPKGEVYESNENDNVRRVVERIYPNNGIEDPDFNLENNRCTQPG